MKYTELNDAAKEKAREWIAGTQCDEGWWEGVYEDAKTCLGFLGFDVNDIAFSGFSSQGDGASFTGDWSAARLDVPGLRGHAPRDEDLAGLAATLSVVLFKFPDLTARITRSSSNYSHSGTMNIDDVCRDSDDDGSALYDSQDLRDVERMLLASACSAADWIYEQLEAEYDYQTSDEVVVEMAEGYDYNEEGEPE